ncbi:hypothetical protein BDR26DRAFT_870100 [Obelidium mucronatum]|nr:hypothetical protein BDR26DRAFT_870100 [Obelidium mucronatum]
MNTVHLDAAYLSLHRKDALAAQPLRQQYLRAHALAAGSASRSESGSESEATPVGARLAVLQLAQPAAASDPAALAALAALLAFLEANRRALSLRAGVALRGSSNSNNSNNAKSAVHRRLADLLAKSSLRLQKRFELAAVVLRQYMLAIRVAALPFDSAACNVLLNRLFQQNRPPLSPAESKSRVEQLAQCSTEFPFNARDSVPITLTNLVPIKLLCLEWIAEAGRRSDLEKKDPEDHEQSDVELTLINKFIDEFPLDNVYDWVKQYVFNEYDYCRDVRTCVEMLSRQSSENDSQLSDRLDKENNEGRNNSKSTKRNISQSTERDQAKRIRIL